jgi:hypothetical protein
MYKALRNDCVEGPTDQVLGTFLQIHFLRDESIRIIRSLRFDISSYDPFFENEGTSPL